jgi:S-adenosylmethionine/arginine decarboxylase-like enzyme
MKTVKTRFIAGEAAKGAVEVLKDHPELERYSVVDIRNAWGLASSFDIYDCNPETIRNANEIKRFVRELCELIDMKRFGECVVVNFGEDERVAGFSMTQLIETSLISAHFANATNAVYLDVFSCKPYDPKIVEKFALEFFGGKRCTTQVNLRA